MECNLQIGKFYGYGIHTGSMQPLSIFTISVNDMEIEHIKHVQKVGNWCPLLSLAAIVHILAVLNAYDSM